MQYSDIKFDRNSNNDFYKTLQKRVRKYFKDNHISRYGNFSMVLKTLVMVTLYFVPFILLLTVIDSVWLSLGMWILMAVGISGIGLSVMHDASHGAYSKYKFVNSFLGGLISVAGGSDTVWNIQHNVLHHTFTNVTGLDEDIDPGSVLRFSPNEERKAYHKYQYLYAWFLYGMMTISWITAKDFKQIVRYKREGLIQTKKSSFGSILTVIIISKLLYYGVFLVLPLIFSPIAWYFTILGFLMMHFLTGISLGLVFQSAHVVPTSSFPMPDESGNIKEDWAVSQLYNTSDFAPKSKLFSWFVGGLNFQIEQVGS